MRALDPTAEKQSILEVNWDVKKCFENINRVKLWNLAAAHGFPPSILRFSLRSYQWPRLLRGKAGMVAKPLYARRGIVAGSAFAVGELVVYMLEASNRVLLSFPDLVLSIHVDDLSAAIRRQHAKDAADALRAAAACIITEFEIKLELPFAPDKAFLVGNNKKALEYGAKALGEHTGQTGLAVKRLGIDHSLDATSTSGIQLARFQKTWRRKPRIRQLQTVANPQIQVFTCGALPAITYGCEICTPPPVVISSLRTWALDIRRLPTRFISRDVAFAALGPQADPACAISLQPLARYHSEWWELPWECRHKDALRPSELTAAFQVAQERFIPTHSYSRRRKDPMTSAIWAAHVVGWKFQDERTLALPGGGKFDLCRDPPAWLTRQYRQAWTNQSMERIRDNIACGQDAEVPTLSNHAVLQVFTTKSKHQLSLSQKGWLLRYLSGSVKTGDFFHKKGWIPTPTCQHCNQVDTIEHRCRCGALEKEAKGALQEPFTQPDAFQEAIKRLPSHRGWLPMRDDLRPTHCEDPVFLVNGIPQPYHTEYHQARGLFFFPAKDGPIYLDGSAVEPSDPLLARAAYAAVQLGEGEERVMLMNVPHWAPQTAGYAENMAAYDAADNSDATVKDPTAKLVTDCAAVITNYEDKIQAHKGLTLSSGIWYQKSLDRVGSIVKTKAHRTEKEAKAANDHLAWRLNDIADKACRKRAGELLPPQEAIDNYNYIHALSKAYLRFMAKFLTATAATQKALMEEVKEHKPPRKATLKEARAHAYTWVPERNKWVCKQCLTAKRGFEKPPPGVRCKPIERHTSILAKHATAHGHRLAVGKSGPMEALSFLFCTKCGAYANSKHHRNLAKPCPQQPNNTTHFNRLTKGIHPQGIGKGQIWGVRPVCLGCWGEGRHTCRAPPFAEYRAPAHLVRGPPLDDDGPISGIYLDHESQADAFVASLGVF
jgi:hypothetical protein